VAVVEYGTADLQLAADVTQIAVARRYVRAELGDRVPADVLADLQLIASELVTNAVEHGDAPSIRLGVECDADVASVWVHSDGPSPNVGPVETWQVAGEDAITGRGLGIVRRLADEVDVDQSGSTLVVTARRHVG
jgi:anti-sigma regulatory factor (Ser/Thr protein kinase)